MGFLPSKDRSYLVDRGITFEERISEAHKGIVFRQWQLPEGKFDCAEGEVLILLPAGYPDTPPDMFYLNPWVRLAETNQYPRKANVSFVFGGNKWQRWSRHNNEWRPGIDGIWTMIKRVECALEEAK